MKKTYQAENISCSNCANMIKVSLEDQFGDIEVDLDTQPKEVSVEIKNEEQEKEFFKEMETLGFAIIK